MRGRRHISLKRLEAAALLAAHPSRPGSMLAFVALPAVLVLLTLVSVPARMYPMRPYIPPFDGPAQDDGAAEKASERVMRIVERLDSGRFNGRTGLEDADPSVRAATAASLGALGSDAALALPYLKARRRTGNAQADRVVAEAVWWIEHGKGVPRDVECEPLPLNRGGRSVPR
jgi:hypothetical protein